MTLLRGSLLSLIACIFIGAKFSQSMSNSYCTEETPTVDEPPKPIMNFSFTTEISGRWVDLKGMAYIFEYFDHEENKLAYDSLLQGLEYAEIYDLKMETLLFSIHERCTFLRDYKGARNISDNHLRSLEILLNLGTVWKYKGNTTIKGVEVQQWRSCGKWSTWANFTADYYFTVEDQHPFRLEMKGVKKPTEPDANTNFHRIYEYIFFRKVKPPRSAFKPPPGEFCGGQLQTTPPMPRSASFRMEELNPLDKTVTISYVFYDKLKGVSTEENERSTTISDFKRGHQFEIDKETNKCTRKPFYSFENSNKAVNSKGIIHMATLKYFFMDNTNFTYNGVHRARGISCDLYTKKSHSAEYLGLSIVEIFIARPDVQITYNLEDPMSRQPPVQIVMKGGPDRHDLRDLKQFEIYRFEKEEILVLHPFNLTPCFGSDEKIKFSMIFEGSGVNSLDGNLQMMQDLSEKISTDLGISILGMSISDAFLIGEGQVEVIGDLFEIEEETLLFKTIPNAHNVINKTAGLHYEFYDSTNSPTKCSEICYYASERPFNYTEHFCWAFQFDRKTKLCTFFFQLDRDLNNVGLDLSFSNHVDLYTRTRDQNNNYTNVAWNMLEVMVEQGFINYTYNNGDVLNATAIRRQEEWDNSTKNQKSWDNPLDQFYQIFGAVMTNPIDIFESLTFIACARRCVNSPSETCEAFQYNTNAMICYLFNSSSSTNRNALLPSEEILVTYIRLREFPRGFEKIFGLTIISPGSDCVQKDVEDIGSCASECVNNAEYNCQSFELCGSTCLLGRNHFFETSFGDKVVNQSCVLYSRNYIQDYIEIKQNNLNSSTSNVIEIINAGLKQCATICSISPKYDCDTFEFCDTDAICRISTTSTSTANPNSQNSNNAYSKSMGVCEVYHRKPDRSRFISSYSYETEPEPAPDEDGGHTLISMIIIAIGMFCSGFVLIMSFSLIVMKIRSKSKTRVADMNSVKYSKDNPESVATSEGKNNANVSDIVNASTHM